MRLFGFNISRSAELAPQTEQKASATGPIIHMQTMGRPVWTPRDYANLAREAYVQNAIAYRCVRSIAQAAASIPVLMYKGDNEIDEHPVLKLLRFPNPTQGGQSLMEDMYSYFLIAGNAYLEAVAPGDMEAAELWNLRPDRMKVLAGPNGWPDAYEYTVGQSKVRYDQRKPTRVSRAPILHVKAFHPTNDHYGLSPVEPAAFAIDSHNQAGQYNKALLDNMARPSGALVYKGPDGKSNTLSDTQFTRLKSEMEQSYQGAKNAGRPMLLDGGLDWVQMSLSQSDMEFVEGKREAAREIALAFGVPPMLLGIPGDNTYSNYAEANRAFYRQTVLPLIGMALGQLTNFFQPALGEEQNVRLWYNIDEVEALTPEREARFKLVERSDFLTMDEKREQTGYEPLPDSIGEQVLVPSSMVPLDMVGFEPGGPAVDEDGNPIEPEVDEDGKPLKDAAGSDDAEATATAKKPPKDSSKPAKPGKPDAKKPK